MTHELCPHLRKIYTTSKQCYFIYVHTKTIYKLFVGWFCGCIEITRTVVGNGEKQNSGTVVTTDGTCLSSIQGLPITGEWLDQSSFYNDGGEEEGEERFHLHSNARAILVIEKEGVYTRLAEDRFFDIFPCILITGKGFPDLASRAIVHVLHMRFPNLPIYGICDCNPYGVAVLQTYTCGSHKRKLDGGYRYSVPIQWIGLRPSHLTNIKQQQHQGQALLTTTNNTATNLPPQAFQALTELDRRKVSKLIVQCDNSTILNQDTKEELQTMLRSGFKVELEALHWLGMDYMCEWLEKTLLSIPLQSEPS